MTDPDELTRRRRVPTPLAGTALALVAWPVAAALLPSGLPAGVVVLGLVMGSVTGLTAVGLVLVWRAARVVNFAQPALGGAAGVLAIELFSAWHWNYFAALVAGLAVAGIAGVAVDRFVIQRFFWAPRLILTLATIGLAQLLAGVQAGLPVLFGKPLFLKSFETPLSVRFTIDPIRFSGDHLAIIVLVPLALAALAWFLAGTELGAAVRGAAENADRAMLLGIPVRRLSAIVWATASVLSALATMLVAPIQGLPPAVLSGPALLLPALAAAVLARMESLPRALAAGMAIGVFQQAVFWNSSNASITDVGLFVVILLGLLLQHHDLGRADESALSSWVSAAEWSPVPTEIRRLPEVIWGARVLRWLVLAAAVAMPLVLSDSQTLLLGTVAIVYALVAASLVVLTGWAGQVSLGQFAIAGMGAVVAGNLLVDHGADLLIAVPAGALAGAVTAVVIGLPALRIRGLFLAVSTLAFAVPMATYVLNPTYFSSILPQSIPRPVLFDRWALQDERALYWFCLAVAVEALVAVAALRRSRTGRVLVAVRDNEPAAQARGVSPAREKFIAFAVSGALAGLAGALHAVVLAGVRYGSFSPQQSFEAFSMVVIGGLTSLPGAVIGAVALRWAEWVLGGPWQMIVTGAGVLVLLLLFPGGLAQLMLGARQRILALVARRRGLSVAGLTAPERDDGEEPSSRPDGAPPVPGASPGAVAAASGPAREPLLSIRDLGVAYGDVSVLFGVDLDVFEGEIVALLGTNGAGKSTLLRAVSGLTPARRGQVLFDGRDLTKARPEVIAKAGIAQMPGGRGIFPGLTVGENLRLAGWLRRKDAKGREAAIAEALERFPALAPRLGDKAGLLSGGQQQMLSLAQVFMSRPRLLMIDELSLGLAPVVVGELLEAVRGLSRAGATIVLVEQSANVALSVADRAVFMEKGEVRFIGPAADLAGRDDLLRSVFLEGAGRPRAATRPAGPRDGAGGSGAAATIGAAGAAADDGAVLRCAGVSRRFGGVTALDDVALDVAPREIVGILGPNGAGKTTLLEVLSGFVSSDSGHVYLQGEEIDGLAPHHRVALGLGRSFQGAKLFPGLTVAETLAVACEPFVANRDPIAAAFDLPAAQVSEAAVAERVEEIIATLGLEVFRDRFVSQLSTGSRRIVEIGCLLAAQPEVLLLDEPSAGIAQREAEALGPALRRIREDTGAALVIVEHDVPLLLSTCDRLVAMDLGRVIADGPPRRVVRDPVVAAAYLGTDPTAVGRSGRGRRTRARRPVGAAAAAAPRPSSFRRGRSDASSPADPVS